MEKLLFVTMEGSASSPSARVMVDAVSLCMGLLASSLIVRWLVESRSLCVMRGRVARVRGTHESQSLRFFSLLNLHFFLLWVCHSWCCLFFFGSSVEGGCA
jgi:hypothetical protein